jgi:DNA-damage-inducible protein J
MGTVQLATRVEESQDRLFRETTRKLGTTPADAMRVFVAAFNHHKGFPFDVRLAPDVEPFETEEEAADFVTRLSRKTINETR